MHVLAQLLFHYQMRVATDFQINTSVNRDLIELVRTGNRAGHNIIIKRESWVPTKR